VEKKMKFDQFRQMMESTFRERAGDGSPLERYADIPADRLHPLVLAYVGDAYFTLYMRTRLLKFEQHKVRILHTYGAKMVSAVEQAVAYRELESELTAEEIAIFKRGRNAKSTVPKSASVAEYRISTGFEALMGYLYLQENFARLSELAERAFVVISREMTGK
jgi:ribonuclease-3 family protein